MAIKKSELYRSLWSSCDELRGGMDASQYKDYVLTLLFVKYVSDKYAGKPNALIEVPDGGSFDDMVRLRGDKEIGDRINKIIGRLAEANELKGVIDVADFNDDDRLGTGREMVERLSRLIGIFANLNLSANRAEGDDLLGDAYEYLMRHFATESGKSKGQFYTPAEVSRIMARVLGISPDTGQERSVYDPTCGSGSLLLKVADEAPRGLSIFGQEMDNATWALSRMNMFLHGYPTHEIWKGNTLASPHFKRPDGRLKTFDFAVANPPFSAKSWSNGLDPAHDEFGRFELGVPPAKNGDYAFLLHVVKSLKSTGKGAVILPHGVLFRGHAEANIRRNLVRQGYIEGIIGLPPNLFYGTGIPACIIVLDKEHAHARRGIFMIDASRGFMKDGNKNRLRSQDLHKIVDVFNRQTELPRYSRMVGFAGIEANDFNLNIPRYIDSSEPEDLHDLDAHLNGGIPERDIDALDRYWRTFPTLRRTLFTPGDRPGYSHASVPAPEVRATVLDHPEFAAFAGRVQAVFDGWRAAHEPALRGLDQGSDPKALIHDISEDLLARFAKAELVSRYDVYQHLMDYWAETMQDDVAGLLENRLEKARERLEETRETVRALCEPVPLPRNTIDYIHYFCAENTADKDAVKANERKRVALYKAVASFVRAYANLANEMPEAGYTPEQAEDLREETVHYEKVRQEVKIASGDYLDMKSLEPAMRHLLDTYIRAEESEKVSAFDELGLVELLVRRGRSALDRLPEGIREDAGAISETIENNLRRVIIDEQPVNPKYYDKMSELLDALIRQRKEEALDYKTYLDNLVELARKVQKPSGGGEYPGSVDTAAKRALYDNLDRDETVAIRVDTAVRYTRKDDWRGNRFKEREVLNAVREELGKYETRTDEIFEIVKNQREY